MSGGTRTQTTNTTQSNDPWAPAQPALQQILTGAGETYAAAPSAPVYGGARVAGLGSDTLSGLGAMRTGAAAGSGTAQAGNTFNGDLLGGGGTTAATRAATAGIAALNPTVDPAGIQRAAGGLSRAGSRAGAVGADLTSGAYATDTAPLAGLASGLASGPSQTQRSLQDAADGKFLTGGNPHLDAMVTKSAATAASQTAQRFAASGRMGSGRFAGATTEASQNAELGLRYQDYDAERGRQASAAAAIDNAQNARAGLATSVLGQTASINAQNAGLVTQGAGLGLDGARAGLAGEQAVASLGADNFARQFSQQGALLGGAQSDRAAGLAGIASLPTVQSALTAGGETLARTGAIQDAARQDQINADMALFDDEANARWRQLGNYAGLATAIGGMGGTSTGTSTQRIPQASVLQQLIGTALAGANVASRFM